MSDAAIICEELQAIIESHMMDVLRVEPMERETAMIVHMLDGTSVYIDVQLG